MRYLVRTAVFLTLAAAPAGCTGDASGPGSGNGNNGPPPSQETIRVEDSQFNPSSVTVTTGTTVTWNWTGGLPHNVTWVAAGAPAPSPTQTNGTYQRTFSAAGTYGYYCTIHGTPSAGMAGTVTVN